MWNSVSIFSKLYFSDVFVILEHLLCCCFLYLYTFFIKILFLFSFILFLLLSFQAINALYVTTHLHRLSPI